MDSDGDINVGSNTEITVGMQTGDRVQGTDQAVLPVESVVDNNADAIGQQDHGSGSDTVGQQDHGGAVQEEKSSAVKVVTIMSSHEHACMCV